MSEERRNRAGVGARVTCSNCGNQFQAPVEAVLDRGADPSVVSRVINKTVNVAICPQCGAVGQMDLPFLYHDPEKELALVYMPMSAGRSDAERQQAIGSLTQTVMNQLPAEERRGYLLQPDVFLTMDNLAERVMEAEGITKEMIEDQRTKAELIQEMLRVESDEELEALIEENVDIVDEAFLQLVDMSLEMALSAGAEEDVERIEIVLDELIERTPAGQTIARRREQVKAFQENPTRENLLDLLIDAPDEETREVLVAMGRSVMDYRFFQTLTSRIESSEDEAKQGELTELRREILDIRDELDDQVRELYERRSDLLRDILLSDDPKALMQRRARELDRAFLSVLTMNIDQAEEAGDLEAFESLQEVLRITMEITEEAMPPNLRLFFRLMEAEDEEEMEAILEKNRELVDETFVTLLEQLQANEELAEEANIEAGERLSWLLDKARAMAVVAEE